MKILNENTDYWILMRVFDRRGDPDPGVFLAPRGAIAYRLLYPTFSHDLPVQ